MTDLWDSVLKTAEQQRAKGMTKYGKPVTADETVDWLHHAVEEHLDAAVYLEAAKSVLLKLTEANSQLTKECEDWLKLYSDESTALAESRKENLELLTKVEALQIDLRGADGLIDTKDNQVVQLQLDVEALQKKYKQLEKQRESEEASWAAVAKRLRTEASDALASRSVLIRKIEAEKQANWFLFGLGFVCASVLALILRYAP